MPLQLHPGATFSTITKSSAIMTMISGEMSRQLKLRSINPRISIPPQQLLVALAAGMTRFSTSPTRRGFTKVETPSCNVTQK